MLHTDFMCKSRSALTLPGGAVAVLLLSLATLTAQADQIDWVNPAAGDWFTATNWEGPGMINMVPLPNDEAIINNGGTAQITGADVSVFRVNVGASSAASGTVSGTVTTDAVDLTGNFNVTVGAASAGIQQATGELSTTNSGNIESTGNLQVGTLSQSTAAGAQATGMLTVDGNVSGAGSARIGVATDSGTGIANGTALVNGDFSGFRTQVGVATGNSGTGNPGGNATGQLTLSNGNLVLGSGNLEVGTTFFGGQANGTVHVQSGALATAASVFDSDVVVGSALGGMATGNVSAVSVDTALRNVQDVIVGQAGNGGTGNGTLTLGSGDMGVDGDVQVGVVLTDNGGDATGTLHHGGTVTGNSGSFSVGTATGFSLFGLGEGSAMGEMTVDGISDFRLNRIGAVIGTVLNTPTATGTLIVGSEGITGSNLGQTNVPTNERSGLDVGYTEGVPNNNMVIGPGGEANGTVIVNGGDVTGFAGTINVGTSAVAGKATGMLTVNNGNVATGHMNIGSRVDFSGSPDAADAIIEAHGSYTQTNGNLAIGSPLEFGSGNLRIGTAFSFGTVDGSMDLTDVDATVAGSMTVGSAQFPDAPTSALGEMTVTRGSLDVVSQAIVGIASFGGDASGEGRLTLTDTVADFHDALAIGSGEGMGTLTLSNSTLTAGMNMNVAFGFGTSAPRGVVTGVESVISVGNNLNIGPGFQTGRGEMTLTDSELTVGGDLRLGLSSNQGALFGEGSLGLTRTLADVTGELLLDIGAEIHLGIDGLIRGSEYGAIDAHDATLMGDLFVDFNFLPILETLSFDLIVTELIDGIIGNFDNVSILGLTGYSTTTEIVIDTVNNQSVEIYRLNLVRRGVPEPETLVLLCLGLVGLGFTRLWRE